MIRPGDAAKAEVLVGKADGGSVLVKVKSPSGEGELAIRMIDQGGWYLSDHVAATP
ncbi:MAG: hypothetical protein R3A78_04410 [Polyangiales bacterium]